MDVEYVFTVCNTAVLPGWLLLAVAPRWRPGTHLIAPIVIPGLLAVVRGEIGLPWTLGSGIKTA